MIRLRRAVTATTMDGWTVSLRPRLFELRSAARRRVAVWVRIWDAKEAARREVIQQAFEDHLLHGVVTIDGGPPCAR